MRIIATILLLSFALGACTSSKLLTYQGSPCLRATSHYSEYRIGEDWYKGQWRIAPEVEHDTLTITCYQAKESFAFKTDSDSISFDIKPHAVKDFYVQMDESTYAHTVIKGVAFQSNPITFKDSKRPKLTFKYQEGASEYLAELKETYPLEFIDSKMNDTEVVLAVLNWTHHRWEHNGNNSPSKGDAITILNEAQEGQRFPCFAYAIVLKDQLNALGYQARTVYLKTQDAEHRKSSPGHVATEVYLKDLEKWIFVDGQFNVMPVLKGKPLNAVEFQEALSHHYSDVELRSKSVEITSKKNYVTFVYDYLFYFDTHFDNRYEKEAWHTVDGKSSLMLVPVGAPHLAHIDMWDLEIDYCAYTHSVADFYARPE